MIFPIKVTPVLQESAMNQDLTLIVTSLVIPGFAAFPAVKQEVFEM